MTSLLLVGCVRARRWTTCTIPWASNHATRGDIRRRGGRSARVGNLMNSSPSCDRLPNEFSMGTAPINCSIEPRVSQPRSSEVDPF